MAEHGESSELAEMKTHELRLEKIVFLATFGPISSLWTRTDEMPGGGTWLGVLIEVLFAGEVHQDLVHLFLELRVLHLQLLHLEALRTTLSLLHPSINIC